MESQSPVPDVDRAVVLPLALGGPTGPALGPLVAQAPLSIALHDAAGRLVYGNAAYERHFGVCVAEVPRDWSLLADPQLERAGLLPLVRRAFAGEVVVLPAVRYDAALATGGAGRTVWTEGHCFPVRDADGTVGHVAVVHVDVTAWAETEAALRAASVTLEARNAQLREQASELEAQSEELQATAAFLEERTEEAEAARRLAEEERANLGRIVAQIPAAIAVYEGPNLVVRAMSADYQRIIGGRDVLGRPLREALPDLDGQGFFELLEGVYATGEAVTRIDAPARWDGDGDGVAEDHVVDLTYGPLCGADGRPRGVVALVLDVAERARLAQAEREARAAAEDAATRLAAVLDALPDAAAVFDREWRYTYVNPAARALHQQLLAAVGASPDAAAQSVVGRVAWEAFPWLVGTRFETESRRALAEERGVEYVEHAAPLGVWLETRVVPMAHGVVVLNRDVTAERAAQAERTRLLEAEREAHATADRAADRARQLQQLTARLNEARSHAQIADAIFAGGLAVVGADAGALALVVSDAAGAPVAFEIIRSTGFPEEVSARWRRFPVAPGRPMSDAVLGREMVFTGGAAEWRARWPEASDELSALGFQSFVAMPVAVGERALAALTFSFRDPQTFDDATRTFLDTLGEQCALALERQRLHDAELAHAEERAALLGTIQDGFVAYDRERRFTYVNARAEALFDRPAAELLGRRLDEAFPAASESPFWPVLGRVLATGEAERLEYFSPITRCWLESRLYPSPQGVSVVFQDVTSRRRAQDAAGLMAEASRALSASLDYATTLRTVAEASVPRLGDWCAVDVIDDPVARRWPPVLERVAVVHRDPAVLALGLELARRYPTDWGAERGMAAVLRDGTPMFVPEVTDAMVVAGARDAEHLALLRALHFSSVIVVPLQARGLTLGALTLCMTESGRRYDAADLALAEDLAQRAAMAVDNARLFRDAERAREQAEQARVEAEGANRAKSQFLATMSHELRTPLNAIGGYAELLEMGLHGPVAPDQRVALERIRRSQQHLLGLINEVLNYARLEAGSVRYDIGDVRVAAALSAVEALMVPQVRARGLVLEVDGCPPELTVRADAEKMRQVLLNLLSNAVKFTLPGGRITIGCHARGGQVGIDVADTGVGIAADQLERVFEPFVQVGRSLHSPGEGTGLGLAISRDLARGMQGDLTATSAVGAGSTFTLSLPRA